MSTSAVIKYQQRLTDAYNRLAQLPVALKYIPKDFVAIEDLGKYVVSYKANEETLAGWELNAYVLANDTYWDYVQLAEDKDILLDIEIDLGHVNSEDELLKWENELLATYPELKDALAEL